MQEFRSNLKRLQVQLEDTLPDNDIFFDYLGVSKQKLLSALDITQILAQSIEEKNDETRSEVTSLKRFGNESYKFLTEYLENNFLEKTSDDGLKEFLNRLSSLIERTKLTYSNVTKKRRTEG